MNINKADLVNTLAQNNKAYKKYMVKKRRSSFDLWVWNI